MLIFCCIIYNIGFYPVICQKTRGAQAAILARRRACVGISSTLKPSSFQRSNSVIIHSLVSFNRYGFIMCWFWEQIITLFSMQSRIISDNSMLCAFIMIPRNTWCLYSSIKILRHFVSMDSEQNPLDLIIADTELRIFLSFISIRSTTDR